MVSPTFTAWEYPYSCSQGILRLFVSLLIAIQYLLWVHRETAERRQGVPPCFSAIGSTLA